MGSIADTYEKKEVMSHRMWVASLKLDYIEWIDLNRQGAYDLHELKGLEEGPCLDREAFEGEVTFGRR